MKNKPRGLLLVSVFGYCTGVQADNDFATSWFAASPLTPAYQALVSQNNTLAWQYLSLAVGAKSVPVSAWQPLYQAILEQSDCGRLLPSATSHPAHLYVQQRNSGDNQVFQVRWRGPTAQMIVLDSSANPLRLLPEMTDITTGIPLPTPAKQAHSVSVVDDDERPEHELVSVELGAPLSAGLYQVIQDKGVSTTSSDARNDPMNKPNSTILLMQWPKKRWVQLDAEGSRLQLTPPTNIPSCPAINMQWQWFDAKYRLLGAPWPIRVNAQGEAQLPDEIPPHAEWLSAVVTQTRYQGMLSIAEQQRLTLPLRWVRSAQGEH